ncbi:hypothetical protein F5Y11DRAFT_127305 [Daldinia sp. FL1419]|nr:hypothetical protein F5Y11DRAFT_127305 [Daldinia sp. FL1419]
MGHRNPFSTIAPSFQPSKPSRPLNHPPSIRKKLIQPYLGGRYVVIFSLIYIINNYPSCCLTGSSSNFYAWFRKVLNAEGLLSRAGVERFFFFLLSLFIVGLREGLNLVRQITVLASLSATSNLQVGTSAGISTGGEFEPLSNL